jgi:hypothetical protein
MKGEKTGMNKISPFLWFDHQAEEAAQFYEARDGSDADDEEDRHGGAEAGVRRRVGLRGGKMSGALRRPKPRGLNASVNVP